MPGNGSKSVAELKAALGQAGMSVKGVKKTLVKRLDAHDKAQSEASVIREEAGLTDRGSDDLVDTEETHEDEADQLAAMSGDITTNDDGDDVPEDLMPDDYDGLDQEDLLS